MNGFEPLHRRVIDYTVAGQWQEVYDGPIEECEEYRLAAENAKLRELVADMYAAFFRLNIDHCQACPRDTINGPCTMYIVGGSDECHFEKTMRELGIEVDR